MNTPRSEQIGIIGSGLGALAAACTLAARGYGVTVFERNEWVGGKAARLEGSGFRFDMGPTILTIPSVLRRVFAEAGRRMEDYLELIPLDPQWRCFFADGSTLDLERDAGRMAARLDQFAAHSGEGARYLDFLKLSQRLHDISRRHFFYKPIGGLRDMIDFKSSLDAKVLGDVWAMRLGRTVAGTVRSFTKDARVAQMMDHFTQYVGSSPSASPAILCGIAHMQTDEGIWYPMGGMRAVPEALTKLALELGVQFRTRRGVTKILTQAGRAIGVKLEDGECVRLQAVVANSDAVRTHRELIGGTVAATFEQRRRYEAACSGVVLYLGLNRRYEHLAHHDFVFSRDPHEEFDWIYRRGEPAPDPTCYLAATSGTEPGTAPRGGEALYVLVHTPYLRPHHDWKKMLPAYRRVILDKLRRSGGMEDIEKRIVFERALTPQDIHDRYGVLQGAIYGLASHGRVLGAFKPGNRSPDLQALYLAGGAAHPGPGVPMVLMSGWIAADALDKDGVASARTGLTRPPAAPACSIPTGVQVTNEPAAARAKPPSAEADAPAISTRRMRWFTCYARRHLRRHFHSLRVDRQGLPVALAGIPWVIYTNHASWWDPLTGLVLKAAFFPERELFAPIDQAMLDRYRFFSRLGFFGVSQGTRRGAATFLRQSEAILRRPNALLAITPQGRFADARERPARLQPGIGHLARRVDCALFVPLACEYVFWNERLPEILVRFGEPVEIRRDDASAFSAGYWTDLFRQKLEAAQDALAAGARARDPAAFRCVLHGESGQSGIYDAWRALRAAVSGEPFQMEHGGR